MVVKYLLTAALCSGVCSWAWFWAPARDSPLWCRCKRRAQGMPWQPCTAAVSGCTPPPVCLLSQAWSCTLWDLSARASALLFPECKERKKTQLLCSHFVHKLSFPSSWRSSFATSSPASLLCSAALCRLPEERGIRNSTGTKNLYPLLHTHTAVIHHKDLQIAVPGLLPPPTLSHTPPYQTLLSPTPARTLNSALSGSQEPLQTDGAAMASPHARRTRPQARAPVKKVARGGVHWGKAVCAYTPHHPSPPQKSSV